ncbi:hypothetical protein P43SY_002883 [Pythium insidiosum]|uniref:Calcineurin-like phosphoesterase domain-containing protein n=1 Tax=Pythium insidiosum TaxID=114742 RepID=A0AAD5LSX8_PYTIN|nr:hypothetical protein P43SY_002883 [Pythium insidiosum]
MARKAFIIVGVLVVIGIAVAVIVAVTSKGDSNKANSQSGASKDAQATPAPAPASKVSDDDLTGGKPANSTNGTTVVTKKEPDSDPDKATPAFTMLAIGDWGATTDKPGSCCNKYRKTDPDSLEMKIDYWAQINVAEILAQSAAELKPSRIIGHGDNLYWNGAGPDDIQYRMETTFESVYDQPALASVPWINVLGNHDYGGSEFICGDKDYNFRECKSTEEMLKYLDLKFSLQQKYKSPNNDRWQLRDHYYVETVEKGDVSVDIYNIDTNLADSHGAMQICCQCYGYVSKKKLPEAEAKALGKTCNDQKPGDELCAGGDKGMYNACYNRIKEWYDDSFKKLEADLKKSKATWKIINSHYSPHFHMSEDKMKAWYKLTKDYGVHIWFNGHTHGFNHDIGAWGTHFYENGGGGGIQSETSGLPPQIAEKFVKHAWIAAGNPYGFFELSFSKDWIKTQFITFDDAWVFSKTKEQIKKGGRKKGHCWHVPVTVSEGRECAVGPGAVRPAA